MNFRSNRDVQTGEITREMQHCYASFICYLLFLDSRALPLETNQDSPRNKLKNAFNRLRNTFPFSESRRRIIKHCSIRGVRQIILEIYILERGVPCVSFTDESRDRGKTYTIEDRPPETLYRPFLFTSVHVWSP